MSDKGTFGKSLTVHGVSALTLLTGLTVVHLATAFGAYAEANSPDLTNSSHSFTLAIGASAIKTFNNIRLAIEKETGLEITSLKAEGLNADSIAIAVDRDQADAGLAGIDWTGLIELLNSKNLTLKTVDQFNHEEVGHSAVMLATYPGGPKSLSDDDIARIFSGRVTNWNEIGGENLPIQVVLLANTNSLRKQFSARFLHGGEIVSRGLKEISEAHSMSEYIVNTRGSIGLGTSSLETARLNQPKHSALIRSMTFFYKPESASKAERIKNYFKLHPFVD